MIYNSLREPAHRTASATACHPDHHDPGYDSMLLRGTCGDHGFAGGWTRERDSHAYALTYIYFESFLDAGPEHPYTQSDVYQHRNPDTDRHIDHNTDAVHPTELDAFHHSDAYGNKHFNISSSNPYFYLYVNIY